MCLGVPGLLIERTTNVGELDSGSVEFAGVRRRVCLACVPEAEPGNYVLVHAGIAISIIDPIEAKRVFSHIHAAQDHDGWTDADSPAKDSGQ